MMLRNTAPARLEPRRLACCRSHPVMSQFCMQSGEYTLLVLHVHIYTLYLNCSQALTNGYIYLYQISEKCTVSDSVFSLLMPTYVIIQLCTGGGGGGGGGGDQNWRFLSIYNIIICTHTSTVAALKKPSQQNQSPDNCLCTNN